MKISIMGYSGSGKSTLAKALADIYGLSILHLDTVQFLPGWKMRSREVQEELVADFLSNHDQWVIDGNYSRLHLDRRLDQSDQIILMVFNRWHALYRVTKRYLKYRNTTRPDMGEGCPEKLDLEFIRWILYDGRSPKQKTLFKSIIQHYPDKVVVLKDQKAIDAYLVRQKENL